MCTVMLLMKPFLKDLQKLQFDFYIFNFLFLQVMEHPQTVLLSKVLQANISLGNAYANISENSKIVARWIDLQQSVNTVVNGKNSLGEWNITCMHIHASDFLLFFSLSFALSLPNFPVVRLS